MYTVATEETYVDPYIHVYGSQIDVVKQFVYLGSTLTNDGSLDAVVEERTSKASAAPERLDTRV